MREDFLGNRYCIGAKSLEETGAPAALGCQRVFSPTQILDLNGIHPGQQILKGHENGRGDRTLTPLEIMGEPFEKDTGWWVRARNPKTGLEREMSLADNSVTPYPSGKWNPVNWLEARESE